MKRRTFLQKKLSGLLFSLPFLFVSTLSETEIERLEDAFYKSANDLNKYRRTHGFNPGVRVRAQYRDESPLEGVIAPYGSSWSTVDHTCVPVMIDKGYCQPWPTLGQD